MAHMQKFKGSSASHILGHCERERGKEGYLKYRNGSYIDESRTQYNQSFPAAGKGKQRLEQRLAEVAPKRRKDAVTMIDWVVTLPEQLSDSSGKAISRFFTTTLHFLSDRYGEKNLVGAYLHVDETTPHLHYCFVPVVTDPDGTERLCAKQLMSRKELNSFHKELDTELEKCFGIPGLALTGITKEQGGNKSVSELKALSKQAELLEAEKKRLETKLDGLKRQIKTDLPANKKWISFNANFRDYKGMLLEKRENPWNKSISDMLLVVDDGKKFIITYECEHNCDYPKGDEISSRYVAYDVAEFDEDYYADPLMAALEEFDGQYQKQKKAYEQEKNRQECKHLLKSLPIEDRCNIVLDALDTDIELREYVSSVLDEDHTDGIEQIRLEYEDDFDF